MGVVGYVLLSCVDDRSTHYFLLTFRLSSLSRLHDVVASDVLSFLFVGAEMCACFIIRHVLCHPDLCNYAVFCKTMSRFRVTQIWVMYLCYVNVIFQYYVNPSRIYAMAFCVMLISVILLWHVTVCHFFVLCRCVPCYQLHG